MLKLEVLPEFIARSQNHMAELRRHSQRVPSPPAKSRILVLIIHDINQLRIGLSEVETQMHSWSLHVPAVTEPSLYI